MSLTKLNDNLNNISSLPDRPSMTAQELKAVFDKTGNTIKNYINQILTTGIDKELMNKVEKINGKGLSTHDLTDELKAKIEKTGTADIVLIQATVEIPQNTDYTIPEYTIGNNSLEIYFEGCKLIKDENYIEVNSTTIQFKDWNVPVGSKLEFLYK